MTHGSNTSNHHPLHPRDDRETLSALFDGELPGDAMRFALKRLDHDLDWRDTCGRWQLIGDALRGEATAAAPADFAAGVMRKLAAEERAAVASPLTPVVEAAPTAVATRRRWLGGAALAASVAMVAVLATRPFSPPSPADTPMQAASGVVAPAPERAAPGGQGTDPAAAAAASSPPAAAAVLAVADAPPATRRVARRAAARPMRSSAEDAAVVASAVEPTPIQKPFHPPTGEIATRPWPRAVLPGADAGTFSVGFGATSAPSSSFYPFEPRLPEASTTKPAMAEPQR